MTSHFELLLQQIQLFFAICSTWKWGKKQTTLILIVKTMRSEERRREVSRKEEAVAGFCVCGFVAAI